MNKDDSIQNKQSKKEPTPDNSGSWIAIGLCLGIGVGLLIDDLGLGICLGVMMGVSVGPVIDAMRKSKKSQEYRDDEKE